MSVNYFPFKGIVKDRPYPDTGLSTALWPLKTHVLIVPFDNLYLTQDGVFIEALFRTSGSYSGDDTPHVILWRGNYWLEDGHHRVVSAALAGHKSIYARVFISTDI